MNEYLPSHKSKIKLNEGINECSSVHIYPPTVTSEKNVEHGFGFV